MTRRTFLTAPALALARGGDARFLEFPEVEQALAEHAILGGPRIGGAEEWNAWVRAEDRRIRERVDRGVEDSISNLLLFGTAFTKLPRLGGPRDAVEGDGLTPPARARVRALVEALRSPAGERLVFVAEFLKHRGISGPLAETWLAQNLVRFAGEQRGYEEKMRQAASGDPAAKLFAAGTLYETRGLSVDTSLLPNYAIETTLGALKSKGVLARNAIGRIGIIGPGLDFADKREGFDYYPLQSIQPFAVMEAAIAQELADRGSVRVTTLDLNPTVNAHIRRIAASSRGYPLELPRELAAQWTPEAIRYWERVFGAIGTPYRTAIPAVPGIVSRAVRIPPEVAARVSPVDLDVVAQTLDSGIDLIVATNVLVYYSRFQQALAMSSIAHMLNAGGVFLANSVLPAQRPGGLEFLGRRSVTYSATGAYGDDVVVYRKR